MGWMTGLAALYGRVPSDPHHLVSDEFTVPVCRVHHRELHRSGDEAAWWRRLNAVAISRRDARRATRVGHRMSGQPMFLFFKDCYRIPSCAIDYLRFHQYFAIECIWLKGNHLSKSLPFVLQTQTQPYKSANRF